MVTQDPNAWPASVEALDSPANYTGSLSDRGSLSNSGWQDVLAEALSVTRTTLGIDPAGGINTTVVSRLDRMEDNTGVDIRTGINPKSSFNIVNASTQISFSATGDTITDESGNNIFSEASLFDYIVISGSASNDGTHAVIGGNGTNEIVSFSTLIDEAAGAAVDADYDLGFRLYLALNESGSAESNIFIPAGNYKWIYNAIVDLGSDREMVNITFHPDAYVDFTDLDGDAMIFNSVLGATPNTPVSVNITGGTFDTSYQLSGTGLTDSGTWPGANTIGTSDTTAVFRFLSNIDTATITGCTFICSRDLHWQNGGGETPLHFPGTKNGATVKDCIFYGVRGVGIYFTGESDRNTKWLAENNKFINCFNGINFHYAAGMGIARGNYWENCHNGLRSGHGSGDPTSDTSDNIIITENIFYKVKTVMTCTGAGIVISNNIWDTLGNEDKYGVRDPLDTGSGFFINGSGIQYINITNNIVRNINTDSSWFWYNFQFAYLSDETDGRLSEFVTIKDNFISDISRVITEVSGEADNNIIGPNRTSNLGNSDIVDGPNTILLGTEGIQNRFNLVLDYGADPTGVTDISTIITNAIDDGVTNLYIPDGTFLWDTPISYEETLPLNWQGIHITCSEGTIIDLTGLDGAALNIEITDSEEASATPVSGQEKYPNFRWTGGYIKGDGALNSTVGGEYGTYPVKNTGSANASDFFRLDGKFGFIEIEGMTFDMSATKHWEDAGGDQCISIAGGEYGFHIHDCVFIASRDSAIYVRGQETIQEFNFQNGMYRITNNSFVNCYAGCDIKKASFASMIANNSFYNCKTGAAMDNQTDSSFNNSWAITGNTFEKCGESIQVRGSNNGSITGNSIYNSGWIDITQSKHTSATTDQCIVIAGSTNVVISGNLLSGVNIDQGWVKSNMTGIFVTDDDFDIDGGGDINYPSEYIFVNGNSFIDINRAYAEATLTTSDFNVIANNISVNVSNANSIVGAGTVDSGFTATF